MTNSPGPVMEALGSITYYAIKIKPLLPTYIHLIISAIFPIYAAAHASLRRPVSAAPAKKKKTGKRGRAEDDEGDADSSIPLETLTTSDAVLFPVLAGLTLTALYLVIKWLEDPKLLNKILGYYFSWIGILFSFKFVKDGLYFIRSCLFPKQLSWNGKLYQFNEAQNRFVVDEIKGTEHESSGNTSTEKTNAGPLGWFHTCYISARKTAHQGIACVFASRKPLGSLKISFPFTWLDLLAGLSAIFIAIHTTLGFKTPWYLTNLQGFAFCYGSLQYMSPGTSAVGSLLLALLFCYDIYMVFYTPMMVTVATKLDVPIKLLFPKNVEAERAMAMLGLGDIVVPGIMMAFALRFDLYRHYAKMGKVNNQTITERDDKKDKDDRPTYTSARGAWPERAYTSRKLWSPTLRDKDFPKPYFKATLTGYILGMIATVVIMTVFEHAQPALLYLVPGVLVTFWGTALFKGELQLAWGFDEAQEEKEKEQKEIEEEKAKKEKAQTEGKTTDDSEKKKKDKTSNSAEERDVENGLKPIMSFKIYFLRTSSSIPSSSNTKDSSDDKSTTKEPSPHQNDTQDSTTSQPEDNDTQSETSTSTSESATSSTSSAEIVSQEEALEADVVIDSAASNDETDTDGEKKDVGKSVAVSTRADEDGASGVKRRRRG